MHQVHIPETVTTKILSSLGTISLQQNNITFYT